MRHKGAPSGPYQAGHNSCSGTPKAAEIALFARAFGLMSDHVIVARAKPLRLASSASGVPIFRNEAMMSARCQPWLTSKGSVRQFSAKRSANMFVRLPKIAELVNRFDCFSAIFFRAGL